MSVDPRRAIDIVQTEIAGVPTLIRTQITSTWQAVQTLLDDLPVTTISRVVLTGCGDSLFAGMAARWAFERYAGLAAEAVEALELARYVVDALPPGTLVLPISYSGQVARTVEAAHNAQAQGATVVAITGRPERRLAQTAQRVLPLQIPTQGFSMGTNTYIGLLLAAYLLALGLGQRRGVLTEGAVTAQLARLREAASAVETFLGTARAGQPGTHDGATFSEPLQAQAAWLAEAETVTFLGSGPNLASAHFGAAKLFEGAQLNGVAQSTEEWAHAQYFISTPASRTVLLAARGRSLERAREIAREMRFIGTPFLVITDDAPATWRDLTSEIIALPGGVPEVYSPLLFAVPLSLLGYHLAKLRGKQSYNFPSPEHEREHYQTLHESAFRNLSATEEET